MAEENEHTDRSKLNHKIEPFQPEDEDPIVPYNEALAEGNDVIRISDFRRSPSASAASQVLETYGKGVGFFWGLYLLTLFLLLSLFYWYSPYGTYLPASFDLVFVKHQYWRLLTGVMIHSDLAHLLSNSLLFLFFSWHLQAYGGAWLFPILSLVAGVLTHALTLLTYPDHVRLIGASGMVYAMVGQWLVIYLIKEKRFAWTGKLMRVIGFVLIVLMPTSLVANVSYRAHAIGFVVGAGLSIVYFLCESAAVPHARRK